MERMNEILARAASRRISTRRAPTPAPAASTSASATNANSASPAPAIRRAAPRRITPEQAANTPTTPVAPAGGTTPLRPVADSDDRQHGQPSADVLDNVLDNDRILELPARTSKGVLRQAATRPAAISSIRELAPTYAAHLGANRGANPAPSALSASSASSSGRVRNIPASSTSAAGTTNMSGANATSTSAQKGRAPRATGKGSAPGVCPLCHGAGYVRLDVPVGDPAFGQAVRCQCKEQQIEERDRSNLRRYSNLEPFHDKTFETFITAHPDVQEAYKAAQAFAKDPINWLVFRGGPGRGKTHLAAAIANVAEQNGIPVIFAIVPDLLDHLRAAFAPNSEMPYDALFDKIREVQLLVLDDFGAENSTAWATEKLFQLINYRYNYRIPTVITTNDTRLSRLDERIMSRLNDQAFVQHVVIHGVDYRKIPAKARSTGRGRTREGYSR